MNYKRIYNQLIKNAKSEKDLKTMMIIITSYIILFHEVLAAQMTSPI